MFPQTSNSIQLFHVKLSQTNLNLSLI
uniref:Uncharacterized protein n=1 Tax=Anguilla anguilla TaxID=7936 RepID=A0A0E9SAG5_ANGAN